MNVAVKAIVIWLSILVVAVINGMLREWLLGPALGLKAALMLSGLLLCVLIVAVAYFTLPWLHVHRAAGFWIIGFSWFVLTVIFEIFFGLGQGKSWAQLLAAYTFKGANMWPLVLITTVCAPYFAAKLRRQV